MKTSQHIHPNHGDPSTKSLLEDVEELSVVCKRVWNPSVRRTFTLTKSFKELSVLILVLLLYVKTVSSQIHTSFAQPTSKWPFTSSKKISSSLWRSTHLTLRLLTSMWSGSQKYYLSFRTGLAMKIQMTVFWKYGPLIGTEKSITVFLALPYTLGWSLLSQPPFKTTFLRCPQMDEKNIEERNFLRLRFMAFVDSSWLSPFRENIQKK